MLRNVLLILPGLCRSSPRPRRWPPGAPSPPLFCHRLPHNATRCCRLAGGSPRVCARTGLRRRHRRHEKKTSVRHDPRPSISFASVSAPAARSTRQISAWPLSKVQRSGAASVPVASGPVPSPSCQERGAVAVRLRGRTGVRPQEVADGRHVAVLGGVEDVAASEGTSWYAPCMSRKAWKMIRIISTDLFAPIQKQPIKTQSMTSSTLKPTTRPATTLPQSSARTWLGAAENLNILVFGGRGIWPGVQRHLGSSSEKSAPCGFLFIRRFLVRLSCGVLLASHTVSSGVRGSSWFLYF